eukprot:m.919960 g.919960  ORF g.919960 m.919960 type:complete len:294 (+) comp60584_c0_seq1:213-1094(+)
MSAVFLVACLVAAAAAATIPREGWVQGGIGESSCDAVCAKIGQTCHEASLRAINLPKFFENVNYRFVNRVNCSDYPTRELPFAPSFNTQNGFCTVGASSSKCGPSKFMSPTVRRICCCSSTGCPSESAKVDCEQSEWSAWSACSASCSGGIVKRQRTTLVAADNGGKACGPFKHTKPCFLLPCPVDCEIAAWAPWGECSKTCAGGFRVRERAVVTPSRFGGVSCPEKKQHEKCNQIPCSSTTTTIPPTTTTSDCPCENGGVCIEVSNSSSTDDDYVCACTEGFIGEHCETSIE